MSVLADPNDVQHLIAAARAPSSRCTATRRTLVSAAVSKDKEEIRVSGSVNR